MTQYKGKKRKRKGLRFVVGACREKPRIMASHKTKPPTGISSRKVNIATYQTHMFVSRLLLAYCPAAAVCHEGCILSYLAIILFALGSAAYIILYCTGSCANRGDNGTAVIVQCYILWTQSCIIPYSRTPATWGQMLTFFCPFDLVLLQSCEFYRTEGKCVFLNL